MRVSRPDPNQPQLLDWWRPLLAVARAARDDEVPWEIHIDEFELVGRAARQRKPGVWIYKHRQAGWIFVDDLGRPQRFIPYRSGPSQGRFKEIGARQAVWGAGLPDLHLRTRREPRENLEPLEAHDQPLVIDGLDERHPPALPGRGHLRVVR